MKTIEVLGIKVYGYHGCLPEETLVGTWFETDVVVRFDFSDAAHSDDLSQTVDYVKVREIVEHEVGRPSKLIETVIRRIAESLKEEFTSAQGFDIRLRKHNPPIGGEVDHVAVTWSE